MEELKARIDALEKRIAALEETQERLVEKTDWTKLAERLSKRLRNPGELFREFHQNPEASHDTSAED